MSRSVSNIPSDNASNEDSYQPAHSRSLIKVIVVRMTKLRILGYPKRVQWRFWSDCANAQADQNLRRTRMSECTFLDTDTFLYYIIRIMQISMSAKYQEDTLSLDVRKRTSWHVRQTSTQISLRIRAVWLESLLSIWRNFASVAIRNAPRLAPVSSDQIFFS